MVFHCHTASASCFVRCHICHLRRSGEGERTIRGRMKRRCGSTSSPKYSARSCVYVNSLPPAVCVHEQSRLRYEYAKRGTEDGRAKAQGVTNTSAAAGLQHNVSTPQSLDHGGSGKSNECSLAGSSTATTAAPVPSTHPNVNGLSLVAPSSSTATL